MRSFLMVSIVVGGLLFLVASTGISVADEASSSGFMIPEAKQPKGFPAPGAVNKIVIKSYPAYRAARVSAPAAGRNRMFRTLFNHIKNNDIAMTAPVEMTYNETGPESMAFLYGDTSIGTTGRDDKVDVLDIPEQKFLSVAVRGAYTQERFNSARARLVEWLGEQEEWKADGAPRYLAYNSPFVPGMLKYGEVQLPISQVQAAK